MLTRQADVIVAAVGVPHMLTADTSISGAAVVDVGVSRVDGKLTGDVAPDVWDVAGKVSPNPGGVGPLTRAFLLTNVVERAELELAQALKAYWRAVFRRQWPVLTVAGIGLVARSWWLRDSGGNAVRC